MVLNIVAFGLVAVPVIGPQQFGLRRSGQGSDGIFWHCAGVLAHIALASLPASSCPCCRRCTSIVAELAFEGPAGATLAFAGIALAFHPHCAGVIASIMLLSLLPVLRRRHCHRHMGAFALVKLVSLPLLPLRCRQHCKLASAQSRSSLNTRWRHCQHRAIVVAGIVPALLPLLRGRLFPCSGVAALGIPALPPASQTGCWKKRYQLSSKSFLTLTW